MSSVFSSPEAIARAIADRHKLGPEWRSVGFELRARDRDELIYEASFVRHAIDFLPPLFEETSLGTRVLDEGESCNDEIVCRGSMRELARKIEGLKRVVTFQVDADHPFSASLSSNVCTVCHLDREAHASRRKCGVLQPQETER